MTTRGGKGISGTGITALAGGSLLLWSAIQGRRWSDVLREFIAGKQPGTGTDYPISSQSAAADGGNPVTAGGWEKARASSYWEPGDHTASGSVMSATTIASPYLPIGTRVDIEYKGKTASGTVLDFGPADWVMVADPNRFLDIAGPMMQQLTGKMSNLIPVNYRVISYGTGKIYRPGAAKTAALRKRWGG